MNNEVKHLYGEYENVLDANGNIVGSKEKDEYGKWWIGRPISAIWDYRVTGIWQPDEIEEAKKVGQLPGDPKVANNYTEDDIISPMAVVSLFITTRIRSSWDKLLLLTFFPCGTTSLS